MYDIKIIKDSIYLMIDRIPLLPLSTSPGNSKPRNHRLQIWYTRYIHGPWKNCPSNYTSPGILLRASDKSVCSNVGEKIAIKRGFFLRQQMKSSLLTLPSPSLSNKLNKLSIYKQTVCHKLGSTKKHLGIYLNQYWHR